MFDFTRHEKTLEGFGLKERKFTRARHMDDDGAINVSLFLKKRASFFKKKMLISLPFYRFLLERIERTREHFDGDSDQSDGASDMLSHDGLDFVREHSVISYVHENILDSHGKIIASFPQHSETTYHSYV